VLAEAGPDGLGVERAEPSPLPRHHAGADPGVVDDPVGELGDGREVLVLDQGPASPMVPGTPVAAYATTGTSKCMASSRGTQKPSCSERQRYADASR
jgi:hypothetical protein